MISEYDEYLLGQISQTDDDVILVLGSQSQLSQQVVNLVTQDPAPDKQKEECTANEGKLLSQDNIFFVYPFVGGWAIENAAKGLFRFEKK